MCFLKVYNLRIQILKENANFCETVASASCRFHFVIFFLGTDFAADVLRNLKKYAAVEQEKEMNSISLSTVRSSKLDQ